MLEQQLSKGGKAIAWVLMAVLGVYLMYATFTESGPAAWLIEAQANLIGGYSLKLTFVLLFLPAAFAAYGAGFLYDYLTGQGKFTPRREVRIVAVSPGPAPEEVRRAWVGLTVPLAAGETGPRPVKTAGNAEEKVGYVVDSARALAVLATHAPAAAAWWKKNAPDYLQPGRALLFPPESCQEVEGPA
jgi:hypothetical protein